MKILKTLLLLAAPFMVTAQTTVYTGNVQLGTQAAIDAFGSQYTSVTGKLQVYGPTVKNLAPLANIDTVWGKMEILTTDSLKTLNGLQVKYVGSNVYLEGNKDLRSITALQALTYIGKDLIILDCDSLKSLSGLQNLDSLKGSIYIGTQAWTTPAVVKSNDSLDNLCALSNVITSGGFLGSYFVANNAYNPLLGDYATGKCANTVFKGNVQLGTQAAIDAFSNQYTSVTGKLQIFGTTVKNLAPLSNIDTVWGKLEILTTDSLETFNGLQVKYTGSNVYLEGNKQLKSISALQALKYIGKDLIVLDCDSLKNLNGLQNLDSLKGNIYIGTQAWTTPAVAKSNDSLANFCALSNIIMNGGFLGNYFVDNNAYNPLLGDYANGKCTSNVFNGNVQLGTQVEIDAFSSQYTVITGKLQIFGATPKDLSPLSNIDTVRGKLEILTTDSLTSLDGLNIKSVGSNVYIGSNKSLLNIDGLQSLKYIGKDVVILDCERLKSLNGFTSLDSIVGSLYIGTEAWKNPPVAKGNDSLSNFCGLKNVLTNNGLVGSYNVDNNGYNPLKTDITTGNCNKPLSINNIENIRKGFAYTTSDEFIIRMSNLTAIKNVKLYNTNGQVISASINIDTNNECKINHSYLPSGLYIAVVTFENGTEHFKLIK